MYTHLGQQAAPSHDPNYVGVPRLLNVVGRDDNAHTWQNNDKIIAMMIVIVIICKSNDVEAHAWYDDNDGDNND